MKKVILSLLALSAGGFATAATINVPGDQATVQAAVNAAALTGDEIVIAAGTYVGGIHVEGKSLTIRGASAVTRPVLVVTQNGSASGTGTGLATAGVLIAGDGVTVDMSDLILIPSTSTTPGRFIQTTTLTAAATITANFTNLLITGNNGSDAPSVTSVFDTITPLGTVSTSDVMYLVNRAFTPPSLVDAVGVYTLTDVTIIGGGREGITAYPNGLGSSLTASGLKIARVTRNPIQWGDDNLQHTAFTITGTRANPGALIVNNTGTFSGPDVTGINAGGVVTVDHLAHLSNSGPFYVGADSAASVSIADSLFVGGPATASGLYFNTGGTNAGTISVTGSTFFENGLSSNTQGSILFDTALATYTLSNNVIAGAGRGGVVYQAAATGAQVTLSNNAFAGAGAHALGAVEVGPNGPAASLTGTVTDDPGFSSTTITSLADLLTAFDVSAAAFDNAGTLGSDISGWGDLNVPSAANDLWQVYQ
ncbi:hypothetical protein IT570_13275 [Candidatus Sumerlaeota bacterium]|nr:hypothetical protein [Candidatus Sumerlaeota bacterium]